MTFESIDDYLATLDSNKREALQQLREVILEIVPEATECISYGMPAFRVNGKVVAGFAAFKNHLSYLPHSGHVLDKLSTELAGYSQSQGALRFAIDEPLPKALVKKLIDTRTAQLAQ